MGDAANSTWLPDLSNSSDANLNTTTDPGRNNTVVLVIQGFVIPVIIFGNALILAAIHKSSCLRKTTYYLIGNLAVADLLFGLILGVRVVLMLLDRITSFVCLLINLVGLIPTACSTSAILIICVQNLTIVKFLHTTKPGLSSKVATVLIAVSWGLWFVVSFLGYMTAHSDAQLDNRCFLGNGQYDRGFLATLSVIGMLQLVVIFILQALTIFTIQQEKRFLQRQMQANVEPVTNAIKLNILQKATRLGRIITVLLAVTLLSWGPFIFGLAIFVLCPSENCITGDLLMALLTFTAINSTVNVFIYRLKSKQFRDAFASLLWCQNSVTPTDSVL
jgi:hypothetical protein